MNGSHGETNMKRERKVYDSEEMNPKKLESSPPLK